jgi:hypothetical protein
MRLALPLQNAMKVQAHGRVRVAENAGNPGIGQHKVDAQLLVEFAPERLGDRLSGFDLAAGKLPVAGVGLSPRSLRQEKAAIFALDYGGRNVHHLRRMKDEG